ncbi:DUF6318 family protein [Kribbella sp. NPDC051620]|uniref:DUF6318 family protein n=1 Tax=Kribbella sp. NPDC051620 TaxID=3364120 RepID=UPI0037899E58
MTTRNRQATALTLACLCAAILTSCNNKSPEAGQPNTAPPGSGPTSSATSTPTAGNPTQITSTPSAAPERPKAAEGLTLPAAEAFVRHYVELMNYASATGDTPPLLSASDSGCRQCRIYADYVKKVNAANGGLSGDFSERVDDIPDLFRGENGRLGGYAKVTVGAYTSKDSPTAKPVTSTVRKYKREFTLAPQQGAWVMYEMDLVPQ